MHPRRSERWQLPGQEREKLEGATDRKEREEEKDGQRHGDLRCSNVALAGAAEEARTVRSPGPSAVEVVPGDGLDGSRQEKALGSHAELPLLLHLTREIETGA